MPVKLEPIFLSGTSPSGAYLIHPAEFADERGAFCVLYETADLKRAGLNTSFLQQSMSVSKKNVVRGLHYQVGAHAQAKLVRCIKGEIWDVIVDLRKSSPSFGKWQGFKLTDENRLALYIPRGFAHGFAAITDGATVLYQLDNEYAPKEEGGVRYDDPKLAIPWPVKTHPAPEGRSISNPAGLVTPLLSPKDLKWPLLKDAKIFE